MVYAERNSGKPWRLADVRLLRDLQKLNTPMEVISVKLGRTESAVRIKAREEKNLLKAALRPTGES